MMKGLISVQPQQQEQVQVDLQENMSNLTTSASGDQASVSSAENIIRAEDGSCSFPPYCFAPPPVQSQPPLKKKRNLPGNPDPDAEVIALSPKTLMATNRFVCEVCSKGFQRDQNLQLHRRGHNLPWKLKQRSSKEVRKKVYVCPEAGCVHNDPSRALGDLTGIKKHFCRKHGEKKWKCDKCSKRYAVQSDWKAHSKTCGTREYRCDCGTLFSRRDSFITHRAFCDALAEESARAGAGLNPLLQVESSHQQATGSTGTNHLQKVQLPQFMNASLNHMSHIDLQQNPFSFKKEQQNFPPWLSSCPPPALVVGLGPGPGPGPGPRQGGPPPPIDLPSASSTTSFPIFNTRVRVEVLDEYDQEYPQHENPNSKNPNPSGLGPILAPYYPTTASSAHMSATALLQKAAQMGSSSSSKATAACASTSSRSYHHAHVSANSGNSTPTGFGLNLLSSRDHLQEMALSSFGNANKAAAGPGGPPPPPSFFYQEDMLMNSLSSGNIDHDGSTTFEDHITMVNGFLDAKKEDDQYGTISSPAGVSSRTNNEEIIMSGSGGNNGGRGGGNDGMTRDFLGLRSALSHGDILSVAALANCSNYLDHESQTPKSWQGD